MDNKNTGIIQKATLFILLFTLLIIVIVAIGNWTLFERVSSNETKIESLAKDLLQMQQQQ